YVKIAGMNPFENDVPEGDEPRAYGAKPIHQRIVVILAGPLSHFVVAWLICTALFMFSANWNVPGIVGVTQTMDGKPSPASVAGIQAGDVIERIGDLDQAPRAQHGTQQPT